MTSCAASKGSRKPKVLGEKAMGHYTSFSAMFSLLHSSIELIF